MKLRNLLAASVAIVGIALSAAPKANASLIITLEQVGPNVVATGTGSVDTTDLTLVSSNQFKSNEVEPVFGFLTVGIGNADAYESISGPGSFGPQFVQTFSSTQSGDALGFNANVDAVIVPPGYISGSALDGSATWDDATLSTLGVTPGSYVWTWGTGVDADSLTLDAVMPVPEPESLMLFGAGLLGLGFLARRKPKAS